MTHTLPAPLGSPTPIPITSWVRTFSVCSLPRTWWVCPALLEFFKGTAPNYTNVHNLLGRADYVQTDKTNWSVRYALQDLNQLHDDSLPKQSSYPGNGAIRDVLNQSVNLSMGHSFTSALINEARLGITRFDLKDRPGDKNFDATSIGLPNASLQSILLTGIDKQASGAVPGTFGAFSNWGGCPESGPCTFSAQAPTMDYLFPIKASSGCATYRSQRPPRYHLVWRRQPFMDPRKARLQGRI